MRRKFTWCYLLLTFFLSNQLLAQRSQFFVTAHAATQGLGLEFKYAALPGINLRAGASVLDFHFNTDYTIREQPAEATVDVDMRNAHFMFDVHPFVKSNSFSRKLLFTAGAAWYWKRGGDALATYKGNYTVEDMVIPSNELGELYGTVRYNRFAPYLGLGFENPFPKNRVNIGFAIGTYYMGNPDADVTGTKFLEDAENDEAEFREHIAKYRFLPVLQVNLNIAL